jgi:hypothetical protein
MVYSAKTLGVTIQLFRKKEKVPGMAASPA